MTRRVRNWALVLGVAVSVSVAPRAALAQGQQVAYEEVAASLKVGDPTVRLDALRLLREAGYLEAVGPIAPLLSDPVGEVQAEAIEAEVALFLADEAYTRAFAEGIVKQRGASLPLLAFAQGPGATIANVAPPMVLDGLVTAMTSPVVAVRYNAAYALGTLAPAALVGGTFPGGRNAADRLMILLKESDPFVRLAATHVLGRLFGAALKNPRANADLLAQRSVVGDQIIAGLNDPDELIRLSSMAALGEMRHDRAVQSLTDLLGYYKGDKSGLAALDALAHIAHPSSLSVFTALFEGKDEQVRRLAAEGLGRTGDASALYNLRIRGTKEKSALVRLALAFARARNNDFADAAMIVDGFRDAGTQALVFDYLVELGQPIAPSLAGVASYKDGKVRAGVAEVLGVIGTQASLLVLETLTRDKDKLVVAAARRSQKRLAPRMPDQPRRTP